MAITLIDIWARDRIQLSPLLVAAPAITASFGGPGLVAVMGGLTVVCQVIIGMAHGDLGSWNHTVQVIALALLACLIVLYCRQRARRNRELERVRSVAEATQQVVLRPLPHRMGPLRIASCYLAAEDEAQIGGDLYAATRGEHCTRLLMGDVRGKGLTAISDASTLMGAFREAAHRYGSLVELIDALEGSICRHLAEYTVHSTADDLEEHFVTVLLLDIPDDSPVAQTINCGHPPPLLLRKGSVTALYPSATQPPLGMCTLPRGRWTTDVFTFDDDDALLLYTDGVIEARGPDRSFYPLAERVAQWTDLGPEALLHHIRDDVLTHVGGRLGDDAAMVVIQRLPTLSPVKYLKKVAHVGDNHHGTDATRGSPGATSLSPPA
ncbi:PP2C family protein-serine/threonine phosphatase [Streptomyces sp. NPDC005917]|uniref:PP2C family protein-serine/threonine phosphatase n=1 Tax=unclassified Streptomyces TaxID=2593676 RepID=UPI0033E67AD9